MKAVGPSSSEADITAEVGSVKTGIHFKALLEDAELRKVPFIDVHEKNLSCRISAESLRFHKIACYNQSKLKFLQDRVQDSLICLLKC
mmetsp:Transcript_40349/g.54907  ORF Transcript_40349/g.54907 Transcript_40349/m.54907 type:complete len:88 (-) Transcript_40349:1242-1505(-)